MVGTAAKVGALGDAAPPDTGVGVNEVVGGVGIAFIEAAGTVA